MNVQSILSRFGRFLGLEVAFQNIELLLLQLLALSEGALLALANSTAD